MSELTISHVHHRRVDVDGLRVFYRETGPADAPVLLLLHGFPSSSRQYARLLDALGTRYRLIAPDYPGFGHSDSPTPDDFTYRFDTLADVIEGFCLALGLDRFALYVFDFGAPVGLRLATRHPEWITGLVVQNGNAYEEGLSDRAREFIANKRGVPDPGPLGAGRPLLHRGRCARLPARPARGRAAPVRHRTLRAGGEAARNRAADRRLPRADAEVADREGAFGPVPLSRGAAGT
ncbi:alpha/beta fold hydrolase [Kitasatospora sp. NPDC036755]|uniref:alpha/beta fold hydrolase n=1 Tax=Kitasatospora sp. NPDC036755 TaxID=3154600 RepID=UPI0033E76A8C